MAASGKIMFSGISPELREALDGVDIFEVSKNAACTTKPFIAREPTTKLIATRLPA